MKSFARSGGFLTSGFTPTVQKKKSKVEIEDLFAEDAHVEELVKPSVPSATPIASTSTLNTTSLPSETPTHQPKKKRLSPEKRLERFNKLSEFVAPRLGRRPHVAAPLVRNSAWVNLVGLAANEEQLSKVVDMLPGWKESGRQFDETFSELFVRESLIPILFNA